MYIPKKGSNDCMYYSPNTLKREFDLEDIFRYLQARDKYVKEIKKDNFSTEGSTVNKVLVGALDQNNSRIISKLCQG